MNNVAAEKLTGSDEAMILPLCMMASSREPKGKRLRRRAAVKPSVPHWTERP